MRGILAKMFGLEWLGVWWTSNKHHSTSFCSSKCIYLSNTWHLNDGTMYYYEFLSSISFEDDLFFILTRSLMSSCEKNVPHQLFIWEWHVIGFPIRSLLVNLFNGWRCMHNISPIFLVVSLDVCFTYYATSTGGLFTVWFWGLLDHRKFL